MNLQNFEIPRTEFAYRSLRSDLVNPAGVCIPHVRSEFSPPDFDEIVKEQRAICEWAEATVASMPTTLSAPYPLLENTGFKPFPGRAKYEESVIARINNSAEAYRQQQERYTMFANSLRTSEAEDTLTVLGPLLLTLALSLRITKVSGEIALAHAKKAVNPSE